MARFDDLKEVFGLLPTPYREDLEIHIDDLKKVANFCCESGQHGIVWSVMVGEFWFLGEEERQPGPKHIAEVAEMVGDRVKCIFGGAAGKFLPDEMRRGANGNMPACELADVLAKITELW